MPKKQKQKRVLLNFAHPFPASLEKKYKIISIPFQVPLEVAGALNPNDLRDFVAETVLKTVENINGLMGIVQTGRFVVALPGMSQAAAVVLSVLHGLSGHFPAIYYQVRGENGFVPIEKVLDLQTVREQARAGRNFGRAVQTARATNI